MEAFSNIVKSFERFWGFLNTFSKKWRLLFRKVRLLKNIFREVEAFLNQYEDLYKDNEAFWRHFQRNGGFCLEMWGFYKDFNYQDFFREIEAFSRIAKLFKHIFSGIEAFSKRRECLRYVFFLHLLSDYEKKRTVRKHMFHTKLLNFLRKKVEELKFIIFFSPFMVFSN
jgi:hypothetical protein